MNQVHARISIEKLLVVKVEVDTDYIRKCNNLHKELEWQNSIQNNSKQNTHNDKNDLGKKQTQNWHIPISKSQENNFELPVTTMMEVLSHQPCYQMRSFHRRTDNKLKFELYIDENEILSKT